MLFLVCADRGSTMDAASPAWHKFPAEKSGGGMGMADTGACVPKREQTGINGERRCQSGDDWQRRLIEKSVNRAG